MLTCLNFPETLQPYVILRDPPCAPLRDPLFANVLSIHWVFQLLSLKKFRRPSCLSKTNSMWQPTQSNVFMKSPCNHLTVQSVQTVSTRLTRPPAWPRHRQQPIPHLFRLITAIPRVARAQLTAAVAAPTLHLQWMH